MAFLQRILGYFRRESTGSAAPSYSPRTGAPLPFVLTDGGAMSVATVYRCVKLMSESVANLPLRYLRRKDGVFTDAGNDRLDYLLNVQPDYAMSAFDFWRQAVQEVLLSGNAYIVPVYDAAQAELCRLALCGRGTVAHDTINDTYTVTDYTNHINGTYTEADIIHIKGPVLRGGKTGVSVLTYARLTADIAATSDRETKKRFANGGTVKGLVTNSRDPQKLWGDYKDEQLRAVARDLNERYNVEGENIVASPGQTGFTPISMTSVDMQFLESRKFTVLEICRFFGVPPTFAFADTASNYKTVEQANVDFLSNTLNPLLRNIETELRRKLLSPSMCRKYKFEFDRRALFACDLNGMMNYGVKLLQIGTTVNEVRRMNNLGPVEGGDTVMVSANLRGIGEKGGPALQTGMGNEKDNDQEDDNDDNGKDNEK